MIGYVFWHWRSARVGGREYEQGALRLHRSLAAAPPAGFRRSLTLRVEGAPWIPGELGGYEDWYLVDDWAALGELNERAVQEPHREPHDWMAAAVEQGVGAIYAPRSGSAPLAPDTPRTWFAKPPGMSYERLDALLANVVARPGHALWRRQLVLGPAPEFCLMAPDPAPLPTPLEGLVVASAPLDP